MQQKVGQQAKRNPAVENEAKRLFGEMRLLWTLGHLKMNPRQAQTFMRNIEMVGMRPTPATLRSICEAVRVEISALCVLARVLLASQDPKIRAIGRSILLSASEAGDPAATIHAVNVAIRTDQLGSKEVQGPLARLRELADSGFQHAMVPQGKVHESYGEDLKALATYERLCEISKDNQAEELQPSGRPSLKVQLKAMLHGHWGFLRETHEHFKSYTQMTGDMLDSNVAMALVAIGDLRLKNGPLFDHKAAYAAFKEAALKHEDPQALVWVREFDCREPYSPKWFEYTMKLAVSGYSQAAHELGDMYSLPRSKVLELDTAMQDEILNNPAYRGLSRREAAELDSKEVDPADLRRFLWASEWYLVAVAGEYARSWIALANLYWRIGLRGKAMAILRAAAFDLQVSTSGETFPEMTAEALELYNKYKATQEGKDAIAQGLYAMDVLI
ncbi:hypothetical protein EJ06DRAFT_556408 [Trichodelitschia bisporula]|uniref:Uncharacterized protein n=1 Tax=Trichodelitschia bisporula TaxID=703511 RepID=A0A6G1HY44_9PEZI|nr:hypothetical protein EJ06DRAFT_556408 [Trichodelitschia bisporula]